MRVGALAVAAIVMALGFAGCGGGSGSRPGATTSNANRGSATDGQVDRGYVARANAVCRETLRATRSLGRRFREVAARGTGDALTLMIEGFVKPGIPIFARAAEKFRQLKPSVEDPDFDRYVGLYDPVDALSHELLRAGTKGDRAAADRIERLIIKLQGEQRALARRIGLRACDVDFIQALTASALR